MTALDRRVAERRGWMWNHVLEMWVHKNIAIADETYSPETNLLQAYQLWEEARPEGWRITVQIGDDGCWVAIRDDNHEGHKSWKVALADLPRAITTAWLEAMEATCQK